MSYNILYDTSANPTYVPLRIPITLSLTSNNYNATTILENLSQQLTDSKYFTTSSSGMTMVSSLEQNTFQYQLSLNLERTTIPNGQYLKPVCVFPDEKDIGSPIWTGKTSCFQFQNRYQELTNIVSENASEITIYHIVSSPTIYFKCNAPFYRDTSANDQSIAVPVSDTSGYTLTQYFESIQQGMDKLKNSSSSAFCSWIDTSNNLSIPTMKFNINNVFDTSNFIIDITGSILDLIFRFPTTITQTINNNQSPEHSFQVYPGGYQIYDYDYVQTQPHSSSLPTNRIIIKSIGPKNKSVPPTYVYIPIPGNQRVGSYRDTSAMINAINLAFANVKTNNVHNDNSYNNIDLTGCYITLVSIDPNNANVSCKFNMNVQATLCEKDYQIILQDPCGNSWANNLFFQNTDVTSSINPGHADISYLLTDASYSSAYSSALGYAHIRAASSLYSNQLTLTTANNFFNITPVYNELGGVFTGDKTYNIPIKLSLPVGVSYTKEQIVANINLQLNNQLLTRGSSVDIRGTNTIFRLTVNKVFTAQDYKLVFFDRSFTRCNFGLPITVTSDTTLGWILGFRSDTVYLLTPQNVSTDVDLNTTYYMNYVGQKYTYNTTTNVASITGDTSVNVNLYNYVLLVLDDYTQNHLNDGLVTISTADNDIPLPSYASRQYVCNPLSGTYTVGNTVSDLTTQNQLTQNQVYAANQLLQNQQNKDSTRSTGPFVQDTFGLIPIKTSGLSPGQSYIEFGGTLQNQERLYFGPVNLRRITLQLLNDKGTLLNLNGANWSFSLLVEQLYNPNK